MSRHDSPTPSSPRGGRRRDDSTDVLPRAELSAGAVALLNAIAAIAPATSDPWERFPPVLRVEHVAAILGLTVGSAREAARRGNVPMVRRLGKYMVDQTTFRRWLAGFDARAEGLIASSELRP
jgi:hypothetical protein